MKRGTGEGSGDPSNFDHVDHVDHIADVTDVTDVDDFSVKGRPVLITAAAPSYEEQHRARMEKLQAEMREKVESAREKRGLVYAVSSRFGASSVTGRFHLYAGTTPERAHETMQVLIEEMRKLEAEGVTDDELRRAKVQLKSELVMHAETSSARMGAIAHAWWFEHRLKTIQEVREAIDAVSREQILGLLKRFPLTEPLVVTAIGPCSQEQLTGGLGIKG